MTVLDGWFPPSLAEPWDAVGLAVGDPQRDVGVIMIAVDPTEQVAADAIAAGADLLVTHHPLWLSGVTSVSTRTAKGRIAHRLIEGGCALFNAHTNADRAAPGVNDALADALGLADVVPLEAVEDELLRLTVYVPPAHREALIDALAAAGAGRIGDYDRCAYAVSGSGTFRPLAGATPFIGTPGEVERVAEDRVEMVLPTEARTAVSRALRAAHPYEQPAFDFVHIRRPEPFRGLGRVGTLAERTLADFAGHVAASLPATHHGVRFAGDPDAVVRTVAVCGGSGGSLLGQASRVADVMVTADLKHHTVDEHLADGGCAVVDVAHWASEWPWCPATAARLREEFGVLVHVDERVTDPWTGRR